jgi:hypothetical protein
MEKIDSTINIHIKYLNRLENVCGKYALSKNKIIMLVLEKFLTEHKLTYSIFKRVRYQKRHPKKCWKTTHIYFPADLFEQCCDIRKFCKLSVSRFIALAIKLYLNTIEEELSGESGVNNRVDNYITHYVYMVNQQDESISFHIFWPLEGKKNTKKRL